MIALLGAGVGLGIVAFVRGLRPAVEPLAAALDRLDRSGTPASTARARVTLVERLQHLAGRLVGARGDDRRARDLAVTERTRERHAFEKVSAGLVGFVLPVGVGVVTANAGVGAVLGVVGALAGFLFPDLALRSAADAQRRLIRHQLSAYLDLVAIVLAGGGGIQTALRSAADAGRGQAFRVISRALDRSRLAGGTVWRELERLAESLDVDEIRDLARTIELASAQGARVGPSVGARADALRDRLRAEVEAEAESTTERMLLPVAVMLVGLLLFIGFAVVGALGTSSNVVG